MRWFVKKCNFNGSKVNFCDRQMDGPVQRQSCFSCAACDKKLYNLTLQSKATDTSKTFIVLKVFTYENSDWFCLKAHYLPFIHAKFHSSGSSGLVSTLIRVKMWYTSCEVSENIDKLTSVALNQCYFVTNQSKITRLVLKVRY